MNGDFAAAMHEVDSNLEVRRLMLVLTNVLTPALLMAISDCLSGGEHPAGLAWLPPLVMPLAGALLLATGFLVTGVVARCHYGLVLNGTKMKKVETGTLVLHPLNWLGVTTNFVAVTALSAGLGTLALAAALGAGAWSWPAGAAVAVTLLAWLPWCHHRANVRCRALEVHWQHAPPPRELREQHVRKSLDGTAADISVVVVMAVALFAGVFNALTNLGGIADAAVVTPPAPVLKATAPAALCGFLTLSLLLSLRILVRLRLAFAQHSRALAELRDELDPTSHRFRPHERTYLLYAIVLVLAAAAAALLARDLAGPRAAVAAGGAVLAAGAVWYPLVLRGARRREGEVGAGGSPRGS